MTDLETRESSWLVWLAPTLSAGLLYMAFFPLAIGWFAWFALVPLLFLVRTPIAKHRYLACYLGGLIFYLPVLQWARVADPRMYFTWIALSLYCAAYWSITLWLVRLLDGRTQLPLVVSFPLVWVCLEYIRWGFFGSFASLLLGHPQHDIPGGFSWYLLGHSQHDFLPFIQFADLTGVYGISALIAATNALLFEVLYSRLPLAYQRAPAARRVVLLAQAVILSGLLLLAMSYGNWRLSQGNGRPGPRLALIQSNLPQQIRNDSMSDDGESSRRQVVDQLDRLLRASARQVLDLVVTPETSYPGLWVEIIPGKPILNSQDFLNEKILEVRAALVMGLNSIVNDDEGARRSYNSAIVATRDGTFLGRYDKIHRVPFGEYIPLRSWLPFLSVFAPYPYEYEVAPGRAFRRFEMPSSGGKVRFGVVICYEDTDPAMVRPYLDGKDDQVDFLLNISNEGWFDGTSEHDQHLAICRFRAIEVRRAIARSVNMGISAIIDSNGRVLTPETTRQMFGVKVWEINGDATSLPISEWSQFKKTAGVLVGRIPLDDRGSFYAVWGDIFALTCFVSLIGLLTFVWWRRHLP